MTWTQFFELFSKSGLRLERVLVLSSRKGLRWSDPKRASVTGAVGLVRAVQVVTQGAGISRITYLVRLSPSGALWDTRELDESRWSLLRQQLLTISSSREFSAATH